MTRLKRIVYVGKFVARVHLTALSLSTYTVYTAKKVAIFTGMNDKYLFSEYGKIKSNLDCNYTFILDYPEFFDLTTLSLSPAGSFVFIQYDILLFKLE